MKCPMLQIVIIAKKAIKKVNTFICEVGWKKMRFVLIHYANKVASEIIILSSFSQFINDLKKQLIT